VLCLRVECTTFHFKYDAVTITPPSLTIAVSENSGILKIAVSENRGIREIVLCCLTCLWKAETTSTLIRNLTWYDIICHSCHRHIITRWNISWRIYTGLHFVFVRRWLGAELLCTRSAGVGKVRPVGQIRLASSVHPARGGSSVLSLNLPQKTYRTMSDCFHVKRDLVAHW